MMDTTTQFTPIAIPVTAIDRRQAYQFAAQQPTQARSEQVYRNTLAVLVTQRYLQLLGIETNLETSQSWNLLDRLLENVADLYVPALKGCLECRPVRQGDRKCMIPKEVWDHRKGYVVIQLDEPYQEGQVLGFVESVSVSELPLSYLQPLTDLIEHFLERSPQPVVHLNQWLKQMFEPDWQSPQDLLNPTRGSMLNFCGIPVRGNESIQQRVEQLYRCRSINNLEQSLPVHLNSQDALVNLIQTAQDDETRWQAAELLWELDPYDPNCPVISSKDLGFYLTGHTIALMVGMLPKPNGQMLLLLRVYPLGQLSHLPTGLKLIGLDETEQPFFEVESRQRDNYIQFKFTADEGDRFNIRVVLNDVSFTESFVV
jgi:hypothetical protein